MLEVPYVAVVVLTVVRRAVNYLSMLQRSADGTTQLNQATGTATLCVVSVNHRRHRVGSYVMYSELEARAVLHTPEIYNCCFCAECN